MKICSCTERVCSKHGPCAVQKAVDEANQRRAKKGKPPLENTETGINCALGMFYAKHKKETGKAPCRGCEPLVRREMSDILAGKVCQGSAIARH